MRTHFYLGVDIGTSNTKAILVDDEFEIVDGISLPSPQSRGRDRFDAKTWVDHFRQVIRALGGRNSIGSSRVVCSIAAQGGSFVMLDSRFRPVSDAVSWTCRSEPSTVQTLSELIDPNEYYRRIGWQPDSWLAVCKASECLTGLQREADAMVRSIRFSSVPEFIHAQVAGRFVSDITTSQITGIYEFERNDWMTPVIDWCGLDRDNLPTVSHRPEIIAENVSLEGVRVDLATSAHDQYAAMAALGLQKDGDIMLGTGTAWVINGKSSVPIYDYRHYACHPGRSLDIGAYGFILTLGPIGQKFSELLRRSRIDFDQLPAVEATFGDMPPPNAPIGDADLNAADDRTVLIKRFMEATAAEVAFLMEQHRTPPRDGSLMMTGGSAASAFWAQIIADIMQTPVVAIRFPELTAFGAASIAGRSSGAVSSPPDLPNSIVRREYEPRPLGGYREWYEIHQRAFLENREMRDYLA